MNKVSLLEVSPLISGVELLRLGKEKVSLLEGVLISGVELCVRTAKGVLLGVLEEGFHCGIRSAFTRAINETGRD